jgi:hypothetical protein
MWTKAHRARHEAHLKQAVSGHSVREIAGWLERAAPPRSGRRTPILPLLGSKGRRMATTDENALVALPPTPAAAGTALVPAETAREEVEAARAFAAAEKAAAIRRAYRSDWAIFAARGADPLPATPGADAAPGDRLRSRALMEASAITAPRPAAPPVPRSPGARRPCRSGSGRRGPLVLAWAKVEVQLRTEAGIVSG